MLHVICTRWRTGHFSLHVGGNSRRSEETEETRIAAFSAIIIIILLYFVISLSAVTSDVTSLGLNCSAILCETEERNYVVNTQFCSLKEEQILVPVLRPGRSTEVILMTSPDDNKFQFMCSVIINVPVMHRAFITIGPITSVNNNMMIQPTCAESHLFVSAPMILNKTVNMTSVRNSCTIHYMSRPPHKTPFVVLQILPIFQTLPGGRMSAWSGYVTSPSFDGFTCDFTWFYDRGFLISVAEDHIVVVKFTYFQVFPSNFPLYFDRNDIACTDFVCILLWQPDSINSLVLWKGCGFRNPMIQTYPHSIAVRFLSIDPQCMKSSIFNLTYTVVPRSQKLALLADNIYNCSVSHFYKYNDLLRCNLVRECEGNEDEMNCSVYGTACGVDAVESEEKCYTLFYPHRHLSWFEARSVCLSKQQSLVTFTPHDKDATKVLKLMGSKYNVYEFFVGIHMGLDSLPTLLSTLYRTFWRSVDGRMAFIQMRFINETYQHLSSRYPKCGVFWTRFFTSNEPDEPVAVECKRPLNVQILCEFNNPTKKQMPRLTLGNFVLKDTHLRNQTLQLAPCPRNHLTRDFLLCDAESQCETKEMLKQCPLSAYEVSMFMCDDGTQALHYSLVCDHVEQCTDDSDEAFCIYKPCSFDLFPCNNHQCLSKGVQCDGRLDCFDQSDELCTIQLARTNSELTPPPAIVDLRDDGTFHVTASHYCPQTHFRCLDQYCLPVYLRCNGMADCTKHEDELACDSYTCQGYYRCRSSAVCLHPDHVCDGVIHCPQYDDELVCHNITCPRVCQCQGLVFICTANFAISLYPDLRYLDIRGVHEWSQSLESNLFLIHVSLSDTGLMSVPLLALPNLQFLDLSHNAITSISMQSFSFLENLIVLSLSGNPLWTVTNTRLSQSDVAMMKEASRSYGGVKKKKDCASLQKIDLSYTSVQIYKSNAYANCKHLKLLNISWSRLHTIANEGFAVSHKLETIDLRGTPLSVYPPMLLKNLTVLRAFYSDNPLLCCEAMLPSDFDTGYCFTKPDLVSSCRYLFRSNMFRAFLLILSVLSVAGNIGTILWKPNTSSSVAGGFDIFIQNLFIADLCEGLYMAIVLAADREYRGEYLWQADKWKNSAVCTLAGVSSVIFMEVSAFSICFITLDCFLVLRFPFSRLHFSRRSALLAYASVWVVGVLLAVVPLLPVTSHWQFYRQTGICVPLPFSHGEGFEGHSYSLGVLTVLNFVLFMLITVGHAVISWSSQGDSVSSKHTASRDTVITVRLSTLVMSNALCRLPVGLLGLLTSAGTPLPDAVNVGMAILVLPLNAALNPALYVLSVVSRKRARQRRERLIERLTAKLKQEAKKPVTELAPSKSTLLAQIKTFVRTGKVTLQDIHQNFFKCDRQRALNQ